MRKLTYLAVILAGMTLVVSCGNSYQEQKRLSRMEKIKLAKEDSAALKIAVMPTLDCLPLFVARQYKWFCDGKTDIRLKYYSSQIDCDTAILNGRVEGAVSDLVRVARMNILGTKIKAQIATGAYWQLLTNRNSRIKELKQLDDKMVAMTRYSVTDMLADFVVDSAKLKREKVFKVQINDVNVRLRMMLNNEMDAMLVTEPQATMASMAKHKVLIDTRKKDWNMGVIAFRDKPMKDVDRKRQYEAFLKAYNQACDSINKNGMAHYADLLEKYFKVDAKTLKALPKARFEHAVGPRQKDIEKADKYIKKN